MSLGPKLGLSGEYRLMTRKSKSGILVEDTGWFPNLITDSGLDFFANTSGNGAVSYLAVGSGNTPPSVTDTSLVSQIAQVNARTSPTVFSANINVDERCWEGIFTTTFANGAAEGVISEVGAKGGSNLNVSSRALVRDSMGNPTSIVVLGDEDLVLQYKVKVHQPTQDFEFTVSGRNVLARACRIDTLNSVANFDGWASALGSNAHLSFQHDTTASSPIVQRFRGYTGGIGAVNSAPSGTSLTLSTSDSGVLDPYVPGSHQRTARRTIGTGQWNGVEIRSIVWNAGIAAFQAEYETPITKTNLQTLRFGIGASWGRV